MAPPNEEWTVVKYKRRSRRSFVHRRGVVLPLKNRFEVLENEETEFPGLITGHLPVELQIQIWSHLNTGEIRNLRQSCKHTLEFFRNNSKYIWPIIFRRSINHFGLRWFNFTGCCPVVCWQRYICIFGLQRQSNWLPIIDDRFLAAYLACNPAPEPESESALKEFLITFLMISDWIQWYIHDTFCTPLASRLHYGGWANDLRAALYEREFEPFVARFRQAVHPECDEDQIVCSFLALRAGPLQRLDWLRQDECQSDWDPVFDRTSKPKTIPDDTVLLAKPLVEKIWSWGFPREYNGFSFVVAVRTAKGKELLKTMDREGDPHGLLFADLMHELCVWSI